MTQLWIRVDTQMMQHPKIRRLMMGRQHRLIVVHLSAMLWAGSHDTGGHIPRDCLSVVDATLNDAVTLTTAGLWDPTEHGWVIHDWEDYNMGQIALKSRTDQARRAALKRWGK